jgi:ArsR family transcriptional regulator
MLFGMKRTLDPDVRLLQAAADPTRLAILRQLSGGSPVCACNFTACCDVAQPTVSHHLKVLREAGWVTAERRGSWVWYAINPDAAARFGTIAGGLSTAVPIAQPITVRGRDRGAPDQSSPDLPAPVDLLGDGPLSEIANALDPAAPPTGLPDTGLVTVYGADWCGDCRRTKRFLDTTGTPHVWVDTEAAPETRARLREAGYNAIPVVVLPGGAVLMEPSDDELAAALGVAV